MKKTFAYSALMVAASLLSGCVFAPVVPPRGILYNNQKAPLFGGSVTGSKDGRASAHSVLFLVGWGDASLKRAAENGGIKSIKNTDYQILNIALVYQKYTTIVRGEEEASSGPPPMR